MKKKSIALGALTTLVVVAPVVTMVSCGSGGTTHHNAGDVWITKSYGTHNILTGEDDHISGNDVSFEVKQDNRFEWLSLHASSERYEDNNIDISRLIRDWTQNSTDEISGVLRRDIIIEIVENAIEQIDRLDHSKSYIVDFSWFINSSYGSSIFRRIYDTFGGRFYVNTPNVVSWDVLHRFWTNLLEMFNMINETKEQYDLSDVSSQSDANVSKNVNNIKYSISGDYIVFEEYSERFDGWANDNSMDANKVHRMIKHLSSLIAIADSADVHGIKFSDDGTRDRLGYMEDEMFNLLEYLCVEDAMNGNGIVNWRLDYHDESPHRIGTTNHGTDSEAWNFSFDSFEFGNEGTFEYWQNVYVYFMHVKEILDDWADDGIVHSFEELDNKNINCVLSTPDSDSITLSGKFWEVYKEIVSWIVKARQNIFTEIYGMPIVDLQNPIIISLEEDFENIYHQLVQVCKSEYPVHIVFIYRGEIFEWSTSYYEYNSDAVGDHIEHNLMGWITDILDVLDRHIEPNYLENGWTERITDFREYYDTNY